jgi:hypothetical protein
MNENERQGKKAVFILFAIAAFVCIVTAVTLGVRESIKNHETIKRMTEVAARWDGSRESPDTEGATDAWGDPIQAEVWAGPFNYELRVWSVNTSSKIRVKMPHHKNFVSGAIENGAHAVGKGLTSGIKEGIKGKP